MAVHQGCTRVILMRQLRRSFQPASGQIQGCIYPVATGITQPVKWDEFLRLGIVLLPLNHSFMGNCEEAGMQVACTQDVVPVKPCASHCRQQRVCCCISHTSADVTVLTSSALALSLGIQNSMTFYIDGTQ